MHPGIEGKDLEKAKAAFYVSGNLMAVKYRASKDSSKGKPKTVCLLLTAHAAEMKNTNTRDVQGNVVKKPTCVMSYNVKMGGVDCVDQQLHSVTVMRRLYKWYKKIFIRMMMMCVLNAHKVYQLQGGRYDFLEFLHNVVTLLLVNAPKFRNNPKAPRDNILRLTGRHFPGQLPSQHQTDKRKFRSKMCRVCYAKGKRQPKGGVIYTTVVCLDCPGQPGLCFGHCYRIFHTKFDYS